jgi:hypothetical protein
VSLKTLPNEREAIEREEFATLRLFHPENFFNTQSPTQSLCCIEKKNIFKKKIKKSL